MPWYAKVQSVTRTQQATRANQLASCQSFFESAKQCRVTPVTVSVTRSLSAVVASYIIAMIVLQLRNHIFAVYPVTVKHGHYRVYRRVSTVVYESQLNIQGEEGGGSLRAPWGDQTCRMSILRRGPCCMSNFKRGARRLSNLRKGPCRVSLNLMSHADFKAAQTSRSRF